MRSTVTVLALALLLAGCASSHAGEVLQLGPKPLAKNCMAAMLPDPLPTSAQLVGNTSLAAAFDSAGVTGPGVLLASLSFGPGGTVMSARRLDGTLPDAQTSSVLTLLREQARPMPALANTSLRLLVRRSDSLALTIGRSEYCEPQVTSSPGTGTFTTKVRVSGPGGAPEPVLISQSAFRVLVDERGRTAKVELLQSSGNTDLDQQMFSGLWGTTYRPATMDGEPRAVWLILPRR